MTKNWQYLTIENLEKQDFGNPNEAPTNMIKRCLELCKVPLDKFTVEDLRLMIGQEFSLQYLIPLAIEHLQADIFAEGDFYPCDLLNNILSVDKYFWFANRDLWTKINDLIKNKREELEASKISTKLFDTAI